MLLNKIKKGIGKKGDVTEALEPLVVPIVVIVAIIIIIVIVRAILGILK